MNTFSWQENQLDFVIPTYYKTAANISRLVHLLSSNIEKTRQVRFYIVLDHADPATAYILEEARKTRHNIKVIISQDFVNEDAFNYGFRECPRLKKESRKWFWQQFVKLLSYQIEGISEFIVIWDGDTFPCGRQHFYYKNIPIATPSRIEYHIPYFQTFSNLTGYNSLPPFSFISQYASVLKKELKELAFFFQDGIYEPYHMIKQQNLDQNKYFQRIFSHLCHASDIQQLFSEYESISLFRIMAQVPFIIQKKRHFRHGGLLPFPQIVIIEIAKALGFANVSFESRHFVEGFRISQFLRKINYP